MFNLDTQRGAHRPHVNADHFKHYPKVYMRVEGTRYQLDADEARNLADLLVDSAEEAERLPSVLAGPLTELEGLEQLEEWSREAQ